MNQVRSVARNISLPGSAWLPSMNQVRSVARNISLPGSAWLPSMNQVRSVAGNELEAEQLTKRSSPNLYFCLLPKNIDILIAS